MRDLDGSFSIRQRARSQEQPVDERAKQLLGLRGAAHQLLELAPGRRPAAQATLAIQLHHGEERSSEGLLLIPAHRRRKTTIDSFLDRALDPTELIPVVAQLDASARGLGEAVEQLPQSEGEQRQGVGGVCVFEQLVHQSQLQIESGALRRQLDDLPHVLGRHRTQRQVREAEASEGRVALKLTEEVSSHRPQDDKWRVCSRHRLAQELEHSMNGVPGFQLQELLELIDGEQDLWIGVLGRLLNLPGQIVQHLDALRERRVRA